MSSTEVSSRELRRQELLCTASSRALARRLDVDFVAHRRSNSAFTTRPFFTPWFHVELDSHDFHSWRGTADALAIRYRYSNDALWRRQIPPTTMARALYCALEQYRCQYLFDFSHFRSVQLNLSERFAQWCNDCFNGGLMESELGLVFYSLMVTMRVHLTGMPMDTLSEDVTEATRATMMRRFSQPIKTMKASREQPKEYYQAARAMADFLVEIEQRLLGDKKTHNQEVAAKIGLNVSHTDREDDNAQDPASLRLAGLEKSAGLSSQWQQSLSGYIKYSTEFDRTIEGYQLIGQSRRKALRERLDKLVKAQGLNFSALARSWQQVLQQRSKPGWLTGQEEGVLDPRRLASLVATPLAADLFRQPSLQAQLKTAVSIVVDNSGSLKRLNLDAIVVMVDALVRSLESAGAAVELLGFTTNNVAGGRAFQAWRRNGETANAGRVAELCHIVYKSFKTSYRRSRQSIAAMLSPSYFKESVDGEALLWAAARLRQQSVDRRILLVVSDGLPMESGTALSSGTDYLHQHLFAVTQSLDSSLDIELYGLGVGYDMTPWYRNALAMPLDDVLNNSIFADLLTALSLAPMRRG